MRVAAAGKREAKWPAGDLISRRQSHYRCTSASTDGGGASEASAALARSSLRFFPFLWQINIELPSPVNEKDGGWPNVAPTCLFPCKQETHGRRGQKQKQSAAKWKSMTSFPDPPASRQ